VTERGNDCKIAEKISALPGENGKQHGICVFC